jgi:hypothetical protein
MNLIQHISSLNRSGKDKPKFKVGKIVSKNLLVEILGLCFYQEEIIERLFATSPSLRLLLIENLKVIRYLTKKVSTIKIENGNYYFRPVTDRIIRYDFNCYNVESVLEIL